MNKFINVFGFVVMLLGQVYLTRLGVNMIDRLIVLLLFGIGSNMLTDGMK